MLQKLGAACVAAHNAYQMCLASPPRRLPRHGRPPLRRRRNAAAHGLRRRRRGRAAQREGAVGFTGSSSDLGAREFGQTRGRGTMPHALIGYAGSTVRRRRDVPRSLPRPGPDHPLRLFRPRDHRPPGRLPRFPRSRRRGRLSVRLDTHGGRYREGLDPAQSYAVLERHAPRRHPSLPVGPASSATSSAPASPPPPSGASAKPSTRPGSRRSRSSPAPASASRNAASWPTPAPPSTSSHRQLHPRPVARNLRHGGHHRL